MDFSLLLFCNSGEQEKLDQLYASLNEWRKKPSYVFELFNVLESDDQKGNRELLFFISNEIKNVLLSNIVDVTELDEKEQGTLLDSLTKLVVDPSYDQHVRETLCICFKCFRYNFRYVDNFIMLLRNNHFDFNVGYFSLISLIPWVKMNERISVADLQKDYVDTVESMSFTLFEIYIKNFINIFPNMMSDTNLILYSSLMIKFFRLVLNYSETSLSSGAIFEVINRMSQVLHVSVPENNHILDRLKHMFFKLIIKLNTKNFDTFSLGKSNRNSVFREYYTSIVNQIFTLMLTNSFSIKFDTLKIIQQYIVYKLADPSFLDKNLYDLLIEYSKLDEDDVIEPVNNPLHYYESFLSTFYEDEKIPRLMASQIIYEIIKAYGEFDDLLVSLFPSNEDDLKTLESKCYLLCAVNDNLNFYNKETEECYEKQNYIPYKIIDLFYNYVKTDRNCIYLTCSILVLLSKTLPFFAPRDGIELAHELVTNYSEPIIVILSSNLFYKCLLKVDESISYNIEVFLRNLFEATTVLNTKITHKTLVSIIKTNEVYCTQYTNVIIETILQFLEQSYYTIDQTQFDDLSFVIRYLETLENILDYLFDNIGSHLTIILGSLDLIFSKLLMLFRSFTSHEEFTDFSEIIYGVLNTFAMYSIYIETHPENLYNYAFQLLSCIVSNQLLLNFIISSCMKVFTHFFYPLIADPNSLFQGSSITETILDVIKQAVSASLVCLSSDSDTDIESKTLPYALYLLYVFVDSFGFNDSVMNILNSVIPNIKRYIEYFSTQEEDRKTLENHINSGLIRLISSFLYSLGENHTTLTNDPQLIQYITKIMTSNVLVTYRELRTGINLLLNLVQLGMTNFYPMAANLIPYLRRLQLRDEYDKNIEDDLEISPIECPYRTRSDRNQDVVQHFKSFNQELLESLPCNVKQKIIDTFNKDDISQSDSDSSYDCSSSY